MEILLATGNLHKRDEIAQILPQHTILTPQEKEIAFDCEETGTTYYQNALLKVEYLKSYYNGPILADDSGLSVAAMGGSPGLYSARWGDNQEKTLSQSEKNALVLESLKDQDDRRAFFVCCLILYLGDYRLFSVQETVEGAIAQAPQGDGGFGYDPIFLVPSLSKTMAELSADEKNVLSHRGKATRRIALMIDQLEEENG